MGCFSSSKAEPLLVTSKSDKEDSASILLPRIIGSIRDSYTIIKTLGSGSLGSIFLIKDKRSGLERAAKELIKSSMQESELNIFFLELSSLRALEHPSIMKIYEIIETNTRIYIISEYLSGGQLFEKIIASANLSERLAARYLSDIILVLNYCHKKGVIHRDIKPDNLLFDSDAPDAHLKVIDFGISRIAKCTELNSSVGAVDYMAPERFKGKIIAKNDIWSAGVILFTMLSGKLPFKAATDAETSRLIENEKLDMTAPIWASISSEARHLIQLMLSKDPRHRPTAEEILSHPWIISYTRSKIKDEIINPEVFKNLVIFNAKNKIQKSIYSFVSNQVISELELKKLRDIFLSLDKNGDGILSQDEIEEGYEALGIPAMPGLSDLLKRFNEYGDGHIKYDEFLIASQDWYKITHKKELSNAFQSHNVDKTEEISIEELKKIIHGIEESDWATFLSEADTNKDGLVSLEEFKNYLTSKK